jgi:hypothetical protein
MNWTNFLRPAHRLRSKTAGIAILGIGAILTTGLLPSIAYTPEVGLEIEGSRTLNQAKIVDTSYVGECPGVDLGKVRGRFLSQAHPPAPGQRVVIRNITRGMIGDQAPFTNRNYSEGKGSETATITFGTQHALKTLNVMQGVNDFEYEIRQGEQVVNKGQFSAEFERSERTQERRANCSQKTYCASYRDKPGRDSRRGDDKKRNDSERECRRQATKTTCTCPNGNVVREFSNDRPW